MSKENYRILAVACGVVLLLMYRQQGAELVSFSGRPSLDQLLALLAGGGGVAGIIKGWFANRGGGAALDLLQSIKRIADEFKAQGAPDEFDLIVRWGDKVHEAKWVTHPRVEPKK